MSSTGSRERSARRCRRIGDAGCEVGAGTLEDLDNVRGSDGAERSAGRIQH